MQSLHHAFKRVMCISPRLLGALIAVFLVLSITSPSRAQSWSLIAPAGPLPVPRDISAAVYSSASNRLILFGGYPHVTPYTNDLWILSDANGLGTPTWTQVIPNGAPGSPQARAGAVMVYDAQNNRAILVGGESAFPALANLNDVWVLINADGTTGNPTWTQLNPQGGFPGREDAGAVYDAQSNRLIVFMGVHPGGLCRPTPCIVDPADVWVLTNANGLGGTPVWNQLSASGAPPGRSYGSVDQTYDPVNNRVMVFGGLRPAQPQVLNDVWVLTNANGLGNTPPTWTQLSPSGSLPAARSGNTAFYDVQTNRLVIFGGSNEGVGGPLTNFSDIWALDNANGLSGAPAWNQLNPNGLAITPHVGSSGLYDSARNRMILFGGGVNGFVANETWVLSDANGIPISQLKIDAVQPNHGGQGTVTVQVVGGGFQPGATVKLTGLGPDIVGANTTVSNLSVITTTFDLTGATPGSHDVVLTNPDSTAATLASSFTVDQGGAPDIWVDILGRSRIRIGSEQIYYIVFGNRGNLDATYAPLWLRFPQFLNYNVSAPALVIPTQIETDTVLTSDIFTVPAGSSGAIPIVLAAPDSTTFQLRSWTIEVPDSLNNAGVLPNTASLNKAMNGATVQASTRFSGWREALDAILHWVLDVSPYAIEEPAGVVVDIGVHLPQLGICGVIAAVSLKQSALGITDLNSVPEILPFDDPRYVTLGNVLQQLQTAAGSAGLVCGTPPPNSPTLSVQPGGSLDPNDKVGSTGTGISRFISSQSKTSYSIYFDNQPTATAPAQSVAITDTLNPNLDFATLALGPVTFQNEILTPPSTPLSLAPFSTTVDLRPTRNLLVKINASFNTSTRVLTWAFQSLDPATGLPPTDPLAGFLPPGAEGSVFFTVMPKSTVTTGTVIQNKATIVFDINPPLDTPTWSNTIDNTSPTSRVIALPTTEATASFTASWAGSDAGSGIQDFTIYVSDNAGPFAPFQTNTTATSATFNGQTGHTYAFYSIARDLVGNVEGAKTVGEATTQVVTDTTPPVTTASASPTPNGAGWNNSNVTVTLNSTDNELGGTGVKQIQWSLAGAQTGSSTVPGSTTTVTISSEGITTLTYFGTDNAGNVEAVKTITVKIDKTPPVITASANPSVLWPPNGKMMDVTVSGTMADNLSGVNSSTVAFAVKDSYGLVQPTGPVSLALNGAYSFTISLEARRDGQDQNGRVYTIIVSAQDNAGNAGPATTAVIVPHDQGN